MERAPERGAILSCVECGAVAADDARGWRAYLVDGDTGDDEVAVFCPSCAEHEFGTG